MQNGHCFFYTEKQKSSPDSSNKNMADIYIPKIGFDNFLNSLWNDIISDSDHPYNEGQYPKDVEIYLANAQLNGNDDGSHLWKSSLSSPPSIEKPEDAFNQTCVLDLNFSIGFFITKEDEARVCQKPSLSTEQEPIYYPSCNIESFKK